MSFAYHIALLREFARREEGNRNDLDNSAHRKMVRRLSSLGNRGGGNGGGMKRTTSSNALDKSSGAGEKKNNSVHGSNVFKDFRKKKEMRSAVLAANANNNGFDNSVHSAR